MNKTHSSEIDIVKIAGGGHFASEELGSCLWIHLVPDC